MNTKPHHHPDTVLAELRLTGLKTWLYSTDFLELVVDHPLPWVHEDNPFDMTGEGARKCRAARALNAWAPLPPSHTWQVKTALRANIRGSQTRKFARSRTVGIRAVPSPAYIQEKWVARYLEEHGPLTEKQLAHVRQMYGPDSEHVNREAMQMFNTEEVPVEVVYIVPKPDKRFKMRETSPIITGLRVERHMMIPE